MKRILRICAILFLMTCLLSYIFTGNIQGHEFNRLFPEVSVAEGHPGKEMSGKNVVCLGDSIIGMNRTGTSVTALLAENTGATVYNAGFGGTRMSVHSKDGYGAFSMYRLADAIVTGNWAVQERYASEGSDYFPRQFESLKKIDFSTVDILIIHFGINDFTAGIEPDNAEDPLDFHTVAGALRYSLYRLQTAFPQMQIYVSLPIYCYWPELGESSDTRSNALGKGLEEYRDSLRQAAADCGVTVIDGYAEMGMDQKNVSRFTLDGIHLSRAGRKRLALVFEKYLIADCK